MYVPIKIHEMLLTEFGPHYSLGDINVLAFLIKREHERMNSELQPSSEDSHEKRGEEGPS